MCCYMQLIKHLEVIAFSYRQDFSSIGFRNLSETEKSKVIIQSDSWVGEIFAS